jgi:lipopolysaccharide transport system ATP-binding protein
MSSESAIILHGVHKSFPVYDKPHHRLLQMFTPGKRSWFREFHALKNVGLEIKKGQTLGIVGRNGAGKSTLLQIVCGTLTPSAGTVEVRGRIAALLELGTGFNPEFTGRENVYLNGSVLGLSREEIDERFDEITTFADIGEFIEQPVKSYSSGMYVRLAFAVAIHTTPDILIVDEALSVGDEAFQRKCFARIDAIRDAGATILFVSHSAGTVIELCDHALLLDKGEVLAAGSPKAVVSRYQKLLYTPADKVAALREAYKREWLSTAEHPVGQEALKIASTSDVHGVVPEDPPDDGGRAYFDEGLLPQSTVRYQHKGAHIEQPHIETLDGHVVNVLRSGAEYIYTYQVRFDATAAAVRCGMMIKTVTGLELGGAASAALGFSELTADPGDTIVVRFRFSALLAPGVYFMNAGVTAHDPDGETFLDRLIDALMFRVMPEDARIGTGIIDFNVLPSIRLLGQGTEVSV